MCGGLSEDRLCLTRAAIFHLEVNFPQELLLGYSGLCGEGGVLDLHCPAGM